MNRLFASIAIFWTLLAFGTAIAEPATVENPAPPLPHNYSTYVFIDGGSISSGDWCEYLSTKFTVYSCAKRSMMTRIGVGYTPPDGGFGLELIYASLGEFSSVYNSNISGIGNVQVNAVTSGSAILIPITYSSNHYFDYSYPDGLMSVVEMGLAITQGKLVSTIIGGAGSYNGTTYQSSASGTELFWGFGLTQKMADNITLRLHYESLPFLAALEDAGGKKGINNLGLWSVGLSKGF